MPAKPVPFREVSASLADLVGESYLDMVCEARSFLSAEDPNLLRQLAHRQVDFYPAARHQQLLAHLSQIGETVCRATPVTAAGATTHAFSSASKRATAPVTGYGFYRVGEDGRLYLTTKCEHYHVPLGHAFPGYELLNLARSLGIPNATHNNTRGHITRLLEEALVDSASAGGNRGPGGLDRVLNLETGSLAVEAGIKMMLARFYQVQADVAPPRYQGRIPVFLVVGNDNGEMPANYHGTTLFAQMLRGMWPEFYARLENEKLLHVFPIRPNSSEDLAAAVARYERPPYKIAGFLHEIVMMNYGARLLDRAFLQRAYALCGQHDAPVLVDEIQSGLWAPGLFLFREFALEPSFVAIGKGFPGGEYPASRLLFNAEMDVLPQFAALVTNGQEELASLAYLVTMRWALANTEVIRQIGDYYEERMRELAACYPATISGIAGHRHLLGIEFPDLAAAKVFTKALNRAGFDISAQIYKVDCPPVALTKLPLTACPVVVDFMVKRMAEVLDALAGGSQAQVTFGG